MIRIPTWVWSAIVGAFSVCALLVLALSGQRRPRHLAAAPIPALYQVTARHELEAAAQVDAQARSRALELAAVLDTPDPATRTARVAHLLETWSP